MASRRIAGITLEIGGDATKLNTALKDVDRQLSSTQSKLKDVNKLLKMDPGNTELLAQKQKLLSDAIGNTEKRLQTLKSVQKENVTPEQWDNLQREIAATEQDLESLKKEMKDFGSVTEQKLKIAGNKMKAVGDKITSAGSSLSKKVTIPIVGIGAAAVKAFGDVDKGLDTIIEKTGATGKQLEGLEKIMKEIAQEIPTDFETAGEAVGEVSTRFGVNGDELKKLSTLYIKFAKINKTDVTNAVDMSQKALAAFGLSADDAEGYLDILSKTSQDTGVSIDTLMNGAVQNGTAFQEMGLSIDQATVFMGQMEKSGANSETVMQGLRKALKSATQQGIPLNKALGDLQDTIEKGTDSTDGLTEAYKIFGKSGDQIYAAVKNGTLDFKNLAKESKNAGGTVAKTFEETLSPSDKFTVALNSIKVLGADIAKQIMPGLAKILEKIRDVVVTLTNKWNSLSDSQKNLILTIAGIVAAVGPVLVVVGKVISGIGSIVSAVGTLSTAASGLSAVLGAGGPVILAITACIAAGVLIYKNWDKIKAAAEALKKKLAKVWDDVKKGVDKLKKNLSKAWDNIKKTASKAWDSVKKTASKAWEGIRTAVSNGAANVKNSVSTRMTQIKTTMSTAWNNVKSAASKAWETIRATVSNGAATLKDSVSNRMTQVKTTMSNAWNSVKSSASKSWENIRTAVSNGAKTVWDSVSNRMSSIKDTMSSAWESVKSTVGSKLSTIASSATSTFNSIRNKISNAFKNINITNPFTKLVNAGRNAINAIKSMFRVNLRFPKITLPHFRISGKFSLKPPSVPRISVSWYKKAYEDPYLFTSPTVLQTGRGLKGFGDGSGGEIVYGHAQLMKDIAKASGNGATYTINVYGTDGMNVNQLADAVQNRLVALQRQRELACV